MTQSHVDEASGSCSDDKVTTAAAAAAVLTDQGLFLHRCKLQFYFRVTAVQFSGAKLRLGFLLHSLPTLDARSCQTEWRTGSSGHGVKTVKEQLLLESCGVTLGLCPARPSPTATTITTPAPQPGACLSALLRRHVFIRIPAPLRGTAQREREREGEALFVVGRQSSAASAQR